MDNLFIDTRTSTKPLITIGKAVNGNLKTLKRANKKIKKNVGRLGIEPKAVKATSAVKTPPVKLKIPKVTVDTKTGVETQKKAESAL